PRHPEPRGVALLGEQFRDVVQPPGDRRHPRRRLPRELLVREPAQPVLEPREGVAPQLSQVLLLGQHGADRSGHGSPVSDWIRHAIWWQVYPLGFTGAERAALPDGAPPVSRLRQLEAWLPHLLELGCNGLALGPVFESGTHGYDTIDHFRVDRRLGTDDDLQHLLDACHGSGVRVLLDGVF